MEVTHLEGMIPDRDISHQVQEKASGGSSTLSIPSFGTPITKSAAELVKEIAMLEREVLHLERYLLSLYRTAFEHHLATPRAIISQGFRSNSECKAGLSLEDQANQSCFDRDADLHRVGKLQPNETSPAHGPASSDNLSFTTTSKLMPRTVELESSCSGLCSLADHLAASVMDQISESPDRLSEDIIRCISAIYCKLSNPAPTIKNLPASPASSFSSSTTFSPQDTCDNWSPQLNEEAVMSCQLQRMKGKDDPYATMIEVLKICIDGDRFNYAATMLQNFRSLVRSLEKVDPTKMKREQKLAFWINIHNALVMHAYLAYGVHHSRKRSTSSILKAAYNVGGYSISAYVIRSSILECWSRCTTLGLQTLFSRGTKLKNGNARHVYALDYPEPLVHFALCSGAYSDPAVRMYTAKGVFQELEVAKEEFIQASVYVDRERKVFLPKILSYFAKDTCLSMAGLLEFVNGCLPDVQQKIIQRCMKGRLEKCIEWSAYNSAFRYIIHRELAKG